MANLITKTQKDSYFKKFHSNSPLAKRLFSEYSEDIIIQMITCEDGEIIAELINRKKYSQTV